MAETETENLKKCWLEKQLHLKDSLLSTNCEKWQNERTLHLVGGLDISFNKTDPSDACCTLVVCSVLNQLEVVYEDSIRVKMTTPYIPGFLAFREVEPCMELYKKLTSTNPEVIPQVLMFDGNGILHPREFGLASHFGVLANACTIGVAKNIYQMENCLRDEDHKTKINGLKKPGDHFLIHNIEGKTLGAALKTTGCAKRPVYVSIGHRIDLETALWVTMKCITRFRIPEPTRQADIRSRKRLKET